ncbi:HTH-like domain-containing protein [Chryseobacterium schmidteae]|uniref:HTH-like domain-containing protein n=1 Tax=Chryseobacterium schmidteae TaxID=2730404 RepID=UPI00158D5631|nr:hypothetical protein [Chryseobacterium schmidteae]
MRIEELSELLRDRYENAPKQEQVANIHLFGIEYGEIIKKHNHKISEIIKLAEMKKSYNVELSKGIKLSKFVKLK